MSDGISDAFSQQDKWFEKMRERLLYEDQLYGEYDSSECPNQEENYQGDLFCCVPISDTMYTVLGECGLAWCMPCQAYMGEWGVWRSFVGWYFVGETEMWNAAWANREKMVV